MTNDNWNLWTLCPQYFQQQLLKIVNSLQTKCYPCLGTFSLFSLTVRETTPSIETLLQKG